MLNHYTYKIQFDDEKSSVYYGVRSCECEIEDDPYVGSPQSYKSYWTTYTFVKYIIGRYETRAEANQAEIELIKDFRASHPERSLNAYIPTVGFCTKGLKKTQEAKDKISKAHKGKKISAEQRKITSEYMKAQGGRWWVGRKHREESKLKMSMSLKGRVSPRKGAKLTPEQIKKLVDINKGRKHTPDAVKKIIESQVKPFALISPEGNVIRGTNLKQWCRDNGYERQSKQFNKLVQGKVKSCHGWKALEIRESTKEDNSYAVG